MLLFFTRNVELTKQISEKHPKLILSYHFQLSTAQLSTVIVERYLSCLSFVCKHYMRNRCQLWGRLCIRPRQKSESRAKGNNLRMVKHIHYFLRLEVQRRCLKGGCLWCRENNGMMREYFSCLCQTNARRTSFYPGHVPPFVTSFWQLFEACLQTVSYNIYGQKCFTLIQFIYCFFFHFAV